MLLVAPLFLLLRRLVSNVTEIKESMPDWQRRMLLGVVLGGPLVYLSGCVLSYLLYSQLKHIGAWLPSLRPALPTRPPVSVRRSIVLLNLPRRPVLLSPPLISGVDLISIVLAASPPHA